MTSFSLWKFDGAAAHLEGDGQADVQGAVGQKNGGDEVEKEEWRERG